MSRRPDTKFAAACVAYGTALRAAMTRRKVTRRELADAVGVSTTMIGFYRTARYLPRPEIAVLLAEYLNDVRLSELCLAGAVVRCDFCGREVIRGGSRRRYCSVACRSKAHAVGVTPPTPAVQAAVDQFCRECEPEGACRTAGCPLQPFSPLPLARYRVSA